MKKFLPLTLAVVTFGLAAAFAVPQPAQAASGAHGAKAPGMRMKKMADALGLTEAQKAQMKPILLSARQQAMALRADTTLMPQVRQAKMKDLRKSTRQQMMAVLTPAQREKMKVLRSQQRAAKGPKA